MNINKKKSLISIKKAKTSLEKIINMIEEDQYCWNIIIQNMAAIWLIKWANNNLIEAFIENCELKNKEEKKIEIIKLFKLSHK